MNQAQQFASGMDLCKRLFDLYDSEKLPVDDANRNRLLDLFESFDIHQDVAEEFTQLALKSKYF